jgi:hypothetical protein
MDVRTRILILLLSYLAAAGLGHVIVRLVLKKHREDFGGGLKGAGALIGVLERTLTLTFVLAGQYTALALIVTAKSIARFEELKDRRFAEYYLIGTLSSILCALLVGLLTNYYLS